MKAPEWFRSIYQNVSPSPPPPPVLASKGWSFEFCDSLLRLWNGGGVNIVPHCLHVALLVSSTISSLLARWPSRSHACDLLWSSRLHGFGNVSIHIAHSYTLPPSRSKEDVVISSVEHLVLLRGFTVGDGEGMTSSPSEISLAKISPSGVSLAEDGSAIKAPWVATLCANRRSRVLNHTLHSKHSPQASVF